MSWIVVHTKGNNERKATINLQRQGFEVFFPKVKKSILSFNKLKENIKPLFPGYIFVNLKEHQNYLKINSTFGVKSILRFGENNYILPNQVLKIIKNKCNKEEICKLDVCKKGEKVAIIKNKVPSLKGIFIEYIDEKRSFVFIDLLMRKIKTKVLNSNIHVLN
tara:strand:- start:36813 stop:37301 length:489 start_codon:yes stop_codon:yes gene_type:complete